ncbi:MAG: hypothetical protein J7474_11500 [Arthrobacter sp.]|nr:hypothetical protein [Arthrobacter sp.]
MSDQIEEGNTPQQYTKQFDMEKYAFIVAFPIHEGEDGMRVGPSTVATIWQDVGDRPDLVAFHLRRVADSIESGTAVREVREFGQGLG